jgi:hypothetical protein
MDSGAAGFPAEAGPMDVSGSCVQVSLTIQPPAPPDILIVMDRSTSMNNDINDQTCAGGCGGSSKWSLLSAALENLVMTTETTVNWGLKLFGNDDQCGVTDGADVGVGPSSASAIQAALAVSPAGYSPTETAMASAVAYMQELDDSSPKYILLATGGRPTCTPGGNDMTADDSAGAETAVANAAAAGFPTFVVGVAGSSDALSTATLNSLAASGNEPQTGAATAYYTLADVAPLNLALTNGSSGGTGCTISLLGHADAGVASISVTTGNGGAVVPEDPINGWSYTDATMSSIVLNGSACTDVMNGADTGITITYDCGG